MLRNFKSIFLHYKIDLKIFMRNVIIRRETKKVLYFLTFKTITRENQSNWKYAFPLLIDGGIHKIEK